MSGASTSRMLKAYLESSAQVPGFFTQFFQSPPENFHNSISVQLDVRRSGANVATVIPAASSALNRSENAKFSNKEVEPPVYGEEFSISAGLKLLNRQIGENPFQDVGFLRALQTQFNLEMTDREQMIRRGIEVQAAQVFRTGRLSLPDKDGTELFTCDFAPKSTHFPGAATDWDETSGTDRMLDVRNLCNVIHNDGQRVPKFMIMGEKAMASWLNDPVVEKQLRRDGIPIGEQVPPQVRNGGAYHGRVTVGQFQLEMWTNKSFYEDRATGAATKYVSDWDVIIISENARYDLTFGNIPRVIPIDPRLSALAVGRVSSSESRIDLITNAWTDGPGRNVLGSVEARPLCLPTAIDTFGRLNAKVS